MKTIKYSRQREAIKVFLKERKDHPTADVVYQNIQKEFPNISLGTVYRNLSLLSDLKEINKISYGNNPDHFDFDIHPHYHFICSKCNSITDLDMPELNEINLSASAKFDGQIEGHNLFFYGKCKICK
ncbi:MAG: transcriptional repressor [Clostridiales bacterium]|nr:transcriptional repressor [Clostridiales bacterium]